MKLSLYNQEGKELEPIEVASRLFDAKINPDLLHQVVTSQEANQRIVHASAKGRGEVRGGGKKPWRQKGTGRARHGSIRSPLWKGGGVTHGPMKERVFFKKINKKMASLALAMAFSEKAREGEVIILDDMKVASGKTKEASRTINKLAGKKSLAGLGEKSAVVLLPSESLAERRAFRNIENIDVVSPLGVIARDILAHRFVMMPQNVIPMLEKRVK